MLTALKKMFMPKGYEYSTERWNKNLEIIKQEWEAKGAKIKTYKFESYKEASKLFPKKSPKNEVHIGVLFWEKNHTDIIFITKHNYNFEYPLHTYFDNLSKEDLSQFGFIPKEDLLCSSCYQFATWLNYKGHCSDCQ